MALFRYALSFVLSVQLAFATPVAKLSPAQVAAKKQLLVENLFTYITKQSGLARTLAEADRVFFSSLNARDHAEIMAALRGTKKFPSLRRKGSTLIARDGHSKMEIKWLDPEKPIFQINGVDWTYDPSQPLVPQIQRFSLRGRHAAWWSPVPEAEAQVLTAIALGALGALIGTIIGASVSAPVSDMVTPYWCKVVAWFHSTTKTCTEYKKTQTAELYGKAPKFDAVSNQTASDDKNVLSKFEEETWHCPDNNDGNAREYHGRIRPVKIQNGKTVPAGDWIYVHGKFDAQGSPTDFIFTKSDDSNLDTDEAQDAQKLIVHVAYDPTEEKPVSYRIRNPAYKSGGDQTFGGNRPTLDLNVTMNLTPDQVQGIADTNDKLKFLNYRNYKCVEQKVTSDAVAGVDPGSPAKPVENPNASGVTQ